MEITVYKEQGRVPVTVMQIKGNIDTNSYEQLQNAAEKAYQEGTRDLLLDLTDVSYISSAGLRALNIIFKKLRGAAPGESEDALSKGIRDGSYKSPHFKLLKPTKAVLEVLKMTGFDMFLEIHRNLKDAVASF